MTTSARTRNCSSFVEHASPRQFRNFASSSADIATFPRPDRLAERTAKCLGKLARPQTPRPTKLPIPCCRAEPGLRDYLRTAFSVQLSLSCDALHASSPRNLPQAPNERSDCRLMLSSRANSIPALGDWAVTSHGASANRAGTAPSSEQVRSCERLASRARSPLLRESIRDVFTEFLEHVPAHSYSDAVCQTAWVCDKRE
jgi:hypothetical protein